MDYLGVKFYVSNLIGCKIIIRLVLKNVLGKLIYKYKKFGKYKV